MTTKKKAPRGRAAARTVSATAVDRDAPGEFDFLAEAAKAFKSEEVALPEIGRKVMVRGLGADEYSAVTQAAQVASDADSEEANRRFTAVLIAATARHRRGARLVPAGREMEIWKLPHAMVDRLFAAACRVCGLKTGQEEAEGNS